MFVSYFESKDLTFFTAVLERACSDIQYLDESRRETIAARILHLAQTGERDFEALRKYATASSPGFPVWTRFFSRGDFRGPARFGGREPSIVARAE